MNQFLRVFGIGAVFCGASIAWAVLGGVTSSRGSSQSSSLGREVSALWGSPQTQQAPSFAWVRESDQEESRTIERDGRSEVVRERRHVRTEEAVSVNSSDVDVTFHLDRRRKGLVYYDLYDVAFEGRYVYVSDQAAVTPLLMRFAFPDERGLYDDFVLEVNGVARPEAIHPVAGGIAVQLPVAPGERVELHVAYESRGMERWTYEATSGSVSSLRDFRLRMHTDFHDLDFGEGSLSPSRRARTAHGETLTWAFRNVITGRAMTLVMPAPIQPGELASELSFSAPISLFFFFLVLASVAKRRKVELHPLHFAFLAGAFFAFHLLFAYTADRLTVGVAFAASSVTSIALVLSYLRVLVSPRFAFVEAGLAQLVYLVGFALAHFADGFTGLAVTILAILTLFLLMQWSAASENEQKRASKDAEPKDPGLTMAPAT